VSETKNPEPTDIKIHTLAINLDDIRKAATQLSGLLPHTPVLTSRSFDLRSGRELFFKCESFQRTGSFKVRGALNAVQALDCNIAARGVLTASSGNFAQGLAWSARQRRIPAHVIMPSDAPRVKRAAVEDLGATIYVCAPTLSDRETVTKATLAETGAVFISSHDHPDVIAGQGTIALELISEVTSLDAIIVPVGGGGLISGIAIAARALQPAIRIIGAEPVGAADAARSKAAGHLLTERNPRTIAKGLLIGLGEMTWPFVRDLVDDIVLVDDDAIIDAMRLVWERMKLVIEPSAAVAVAAVLKKEFKGRNDLTRVGVVLTGGNVDLDELPWQYSVRT
jgi:threonine dehydratase